MLRTRITFERCFILLQVSLFIQVEATENCTGNVYLDTDLKLCLPCSSCDAFSIQLQECTHTSNTVCLKCVGDNIEKHPECERCPPCRRGHFLTSPCTPGSPNVCQRCRKGSYSAKPSYSTRCLSCLDCKGLNRRVVRPCKSHRDAMCGKCKKGYYEVPGVQKCLPCRPCTSGSQKVRACQRWGGERSCGYVLHRSRQRKFGTVLKYDIQATTGSMVMNTSTEHIAGTPKPEKRKTDFTIFIISLSTFLLFLLILILVVAVYVSRRRGKKIAKTIMAEEEKSLISNKKDTEVALSTKGHFVSLSSSKSCVMQSYLSRSDPGHRSLHQNASIWHDLLSPSGKTAPEPYMDPNWGSATDIERTLSESCETSSLASSPEPALPPPPPPLRTALFEPPEIPPRRHHDFKTI